ncbi:putative U3 small nucleolar RNA-associated protein 7 [Scedosporium apiospermum]|uniref:U three protein 7 n=1 Tax=Pseudallescheria apiosperma TaxID=563466 RepID=A0A084G8V2_PSEDA|nr:putative U3 small nucleolar RNA-associated protein 7 [Scedosporium apiospermum]KEZ43764.1 putative U3 small nucleolar RNA-associated protein 7 [Scedosporium apiospermum]
MEDPTKAVAEKPKSKTNRPGNSNGAVVARKSRADLIPKHERVRAQRHRAANSEYGRGTGLDTRKIKDRKLRRNLSALENKFKDAAIKAKDAEILHENAVGFLETEHELERTYRVRQDEITEHAAIETAQKRFDLTLDQLGPYVFDYSRNGRELLLGGRKGHIATMDWREGKLGCEINLGETVKDVKWLHNNQYFAVAQKKYTYIYDHNGMEIHCLRKLMEVTHMEFLPYHFLLATMSTPGWLKYQDVSTGDLVSEIRTGLGAPVSLTQNPWNAILHAGHQNGTVTLWSPNSSEPLVKLLAHKGPVRSLAVDRAGRYMVSTGQDLKMAVWDIRMFKEVNSYFTRQPGSSVAISDTGLTSVSWGTSTTIWKDLFSTEKVKSPYMSWGGEGKKIERVQWCPFEDVLGLGHDEGFSSILVPGAGEPNFDALEVNPYENKRQRQEGEVKALLNKLQPEMIALDPNFIGQLDLRSQKQREAEKDLDTTAPDFVEELRNRTRGKNSALKKYMRKQRKRNIIDEKRLRIEELWKEQQKQNSQRQEEQQAELGPALSRFVRKE